MGRLGEEMRDPWGVLVAGVAGGVSWAAAGVIAVGVPPIALGLGIGAAVYGVKVVAGALTDRSDSPVEQPTLLRPRYGTAAASWLKRAEDASRKLDTMGREAGTSATAIAAQHAAEEAREILEDMRRVAGQSAAIMRAMDTVNSSGLDEEAAQARAQASAAPDDSPAQQSAKALQDRLDVRDRLQQAGSGLDGRLQASALGLESLVARVAELTATAGTVGQVDPSPADLADLTTELDGMRVGLADVEAAAQKALRSVA